MGYGVRRLRLARSSTHFLWLNVAVALACSVLATSITHLRFDGFTAHESSDVAQAFMDVLPGVFLPVFLASLLFSLIDKLVSGFIALATLDGLASKRPWLASRLRPDEPAPPGT